MDQKSINRQLNKFGLYGFFKNLKFFDPFLLLYLTYNGITITEIGFLWSIREILIYVFEIPSGVFADNYGRKTELIICFIFYIISFILFFLGNTFVWFAFAFVFFGLGEAFRSGTHKAMIMDFMEIYNLKENKSKIYGKTRSVSMVGSMVSSILAILLVQVLPDLRLLFLVAVIPYILDMLLVISYPNELNKRNVTHFSLKQFLKENVDSLKNVFTNKSMRRTLWDSSIYGSLFKMLKDYIQIIIYAMLIVSVTEQEIEIRIAIIYAGMYLISSLASRFSYVFLGLRARNHVLNIIWGLTGVISLLMVLFNDSIYVVVGIFGMFYALLNVRKPIMVERIGDEAKQEERAMILSVESQLTSLLIFVFAPILGYTYDTYGIEIVFMFIMGLCFFMFILLQVLPKRKQRSMGKVGE